MIFIPPSLNGQTWKAGTEFRNTLLFHGLGLSGRQWRAELLELNRTSLAVSYSINVGQLTVQYEVTQKATRQLSLPYGINRTNAKPSLTVSTRVLRMAWSYRTFSYQVWSRTEQGLDINQPVMSYFEGY